MPRKKSNKKSTNPIPKAKSKRSADSLFDLADRYLEGHLGMIFWIGVGLTLLTGALLFDLRISDASDDSDYIVAAFNFIHGKAFPGWHGAFYPIFLGLPVMIFGMNLFALKTISFFLMAGHFMVFYHTFKNRVRPTILVMVTLLIAVNSAILYYASSTFSEALFFFIQALVFFLFFRILDKTGPQKDQPFPSIRLWMLFGFMVFLLTLTRNVGFAIILAFVVWFLLSKQFKALGYAMASFLAFQIPFSLYKMAVWKITGSGFHGQMNVMFQKDAYNPALGNENFTGFIARFLENSNLYLSKHFLKFIGLRAPDSEQTSIPLTLALVFILITGGIIALRRKNKPVQFLALYLALAMSITFITQQVFWDQGRLILVFLPCLLILILYGLFELTSLHSLKILQVLIILAFGASFFLVLHRTAVTVRKNIPVLKEQIKGNKYAGFTPDWVHYFQASTWAAQNVPKDAVIGCRKAAMSSIYSGGREFFGINKVPVTDKDLMISDLERQNSPVIILENFELDDKKFPLPWLDQMRPFMKGVFVSDVPKLFTVVVPPTERIPKFLNMLNTGHINIHTDLAAFKTMVDDPESRFYAVDLDQIMLFLKDNHMKYLVMGNIRILNNVNDGRIVSTIQKLVTFVEWKFPTTFRKVYQAGTDDSEPALVLEITYPK